MNTHEIEWVSSPLDREQLHAVLDSLPATLSELLGNCLIEAMYGCGSNLHMDLCYVPMKLGTQQIDRFIKKSLDHRIFVPAESDLYFKFPDERLEILFCHEGDIHIYGPDMELQKQLLGSTAFRGISFTQRRMEARQMLPGHARNERS